MRFSRVSAALLAACVSTLPASAQSIVGAGASRAPDSGPEACAWLLVRQPSPLADVERTDDAQVLLVPPFGVEGLPRTPGVFRIVRALENWPDAIAADANQLTVAILGTRTEFAGMQAPPGPTEVLSLWAIYEGGRWSAGPVGSLDASPALPPDRSVLAMTATSAGLLAVVGADTIGTTGAAKVMLLSLGKWVDVPLPDAATTALAAATTVRLTPTPTGAAILTAGPMLDDVRIWVAGITPGVRTYPEEPEDPEAPEPQPKVTPARITWTDVPAPPAPVGATAVLAVTVDNQVVIGWVQPDRVSLVAASLAGSTKHAQWRTLNTISATTGDAALLPLASHQRVVVVWKEGASAAVDQSAQLGLRFAEVSAETGRELVQGDVTLSGPATRSDYRAIGILLAWVSGIVAVIVLRPRDDRAVLMPDGLALAEPAQRMIAGTIDLVLSLVAAGFILGRGPVDVLTASATGLLTSTEGQLLLALTMLIGLTAGTLSEWAAGRTIGKALCGCVVADLTRPVPAGAVYERVPFVRCLTRNVVKWCVPPAGLIGVLSSAARHRGDEYAGAAVLSAADEDDNEGTDEG